MIVTPLNLRCSGSIVQGILYHRMGLARPLSRLRIETDRHLTVRYNGFTKVTLSKLATGLAGTVPKTV